MTDRPEIIIYEEQVLNVGQETLIESTTDNNNCVIFEDDGSTGYFYAVDRLNDLKVLDGLHIYDVANITDKNIPSSLKILWTTDLTKCFLSINNFYHAVFDFANKAGYCRNGFPNNNSNWTKIKDRKLTDELIIKFSQIK